MSYRPRFVPACTLPRAWFPRFFSGDTKPICARGVIALLAPTNPPSGPVATAPEPDSRSELAAALRTCRTVLIGVGVFSGVINLLMLTGAMFMLQVYDRVLPSGSLPTLIGLSVLALILFAMQGLLDLIRNRIMVRIGTYLDETLRGRVFDAFMRIQLVSRDRGDGVEPVRDLERIRAFLSGAGPTALFDLPWIPVYMIVIFAFHTALGVTALAGAIVLVGLTFAAEFLTRAPLQTASKVGLTRANFAEACRRNAEVIAAMGMARRIEAKWDQINRSYLAGQQHVSDISGGFGAFSKVLRMVLQSAVLAVGAYLVINQQASAGIIIAAAILVGRALAPVDLAITQSKAFVAARQSWRRLNALLALLPPRNDPMLLPAPKSGIAFEGVYVAAPGTTKLILQNVSFEIAAGQGLGIVGPSGSGKSTLVRALVGVWQPLSGRIGLDGAELKQWPDHELGGHIGYLPQDIELFSGTVAENIARFDPCADVEAIIAAARVAGAHDLIVTLQDGYETQIGEQGHVLSAGQRQRIALARALYRDPFLVVLDEPNSNLDGEGDLALTDAILSVRKRGGIVVIVAHRPGALSAVDHILALHAGRPQAFGEKEAVFATLFPKLQSVTLQPERLKPQRAQITEVERTGT